ncbi:MAG TPA: redoxin domain-containing protein [Polyangiaceae bacterium]|nr:redoxin domain-containing protein [Polyangiaceae bacterium]
MTLSKLALALALLVAGCSVAPQTPDTAKLTSADGAAREYKELVSAAPWTVLVFVSAECPCLEAHLERLRALSASYAPRGAQFVAVDSEVGRTKEMLAGEARSLALGFPLLLDPGARVANALGAEYATYSVVVDHEGIVRYRGGIDSDKRKLHDDATPYLRDALDDLLAGMPPRRAEGKTLGCMLRKW